ncbi:MAG TPA: bifunctional 5,10-methylenetetrahydrofolate dehydrogenase/5,10-methenyltetrahydrofolate cyclohydrolase [Burkholderiales bacterium]|nr:bifunctional 5,10-methylenetetrahydrofolate dehydrogenase/5,10-methenyltetrahydrofolate cyclohydrolase [Burkholderiales bacterium]
MTAPGRSEAATVINGVAVARDIYSGLSQRIGALGRSGIRPGLAAVQVGDDPGSKIYIRNKVRACDEAGIDSQVHALPGDCRQEAVISRLDELKRDPLVHGILLQLPLPRHLDAEAIMQSIAPEKDVDGLTWHSLGALLAGRPLFEPCTPAGVIALLDHAGIGIDRRYAVVVGRSTIVGKPMALMLMARGATVTLCHSRTSDLRGETRRADILVAATGHARLITGDMVKPGAAVMDVGINRLPDGKLAGDADPESVSRVAGWMTPVPGGVGPMTVAMLISNTVAAAERTRVR